MIVVHEERDTASPTRAFDNSLRQRDPRDDHMIDHHETTKVTSSKEELT